MEVSITLSKASRRRVPARSELQQELSEVVRHRAAVSEVLLVIAGSPHDLQPIFDTIIPSATRLCRANSGTLRLVEDKGLRLVAEMLQPKTLSDRWSPPILAEPGSSLLARVANGPLVHIPDLDLVRDLHRYTAAAEARKSLGLRPMLAVPMLDRKSVV